MRIVTRKNTIVTKTHEFTEQEILNALCNQYAIEQITRPGKSVRLEMDTEGATIITCEDTLESESSP